MMEPATQFILKGARRVLPKGLLLAALTACRVRAPPLALRPRAGRTPIIAYAGAYNAVNTAWMLMRWEWQTERVDVRMCCEAFACIRAAQSEKARLALQDMGIDSLAALEEKLVRFCAIGLERSR